MICFRDMTFCNSQCANYQCSRKLTQQIEIDAKRWWGNENAPIAVSDFRCEKMIPTQNPEPPNE